MQSTYIQETLIQAHIAELHRAASASRARRVETSSTPRRRFRRFRSRHAAAPQIAAPAIAV